MRRTSRRLHTWSWSCPVDRFRQSDKTSVEVSITNSMVAVAPTSLGTAIISTTKAEVVVKLLKQREPGTHGVG